jgi:hypothetical protein
MPTVEQLSEIDNRTSEYYKREELLARYLDETHEYAIAHPDDRWGSDPFVSRYSTVVDMLLNDGWGRDDEKVIEELLQAGIYEGKRLDIPYLHNRPGGHSTEWPHLGFYKKDLLERLRSRFELAALRIDDPVTFKSLFTAEGTIALHGTSGLALPGIIEQRAILSHHDQYERHVLTCSGEAFLAAAFRRKFVSFDEILSPRPLFYAQRCEDYAGRKKTLMTLSSQGLAGARQHLQELETFDTWLGTGGDNNEYYKKVNEKRFGIVLGIGLRAIVSAGIDESVGRLVGVDADEEEIAFAHKVGTSFLTVIGVPDSQRSLVDQYVANSSIDEAVRPRIISIDSLMAAYRTAQCIITNYSRSYTEDMYQPRKR